MSLPENFICRPYRGVSVQHWPGLLGEEAVKETLLSREAYRRTEFVVLRGEDGATALVRVLCAAQEELFNPIVAVEWLGGPDDCEYVVRHLGVDVNLGNVATDEVIALETLRRGLRADTAGLAMRRSGNPSEGWEPTGGR